MNNTPTPRTDEFSKTAYDTDIDDYVAYNKAVAFAQNLETELTAVTEQLAEMTLRWELTNDSLFDKRALADRLAEALKELLTTGDNGYGTPTDKAWEMAEQAIAAVKGGSDG
jgi:hypothetical protein